MATATASFRPPHKRLKSKKTGTSAQTSPEFDTVPQIPSASKPVAAGAVLGANIPAESTATKQGDADFLPLSLQHLQDRYTFTKMSIISSSKIEQKVGVLLKHLSQFSFAEPKTKPGVVVLHAKAGVASKMVSIVQIAKRNVEGSWFQYSRLSGVMGEAKEVKKGRKESGGGGGGVEGRGEGKGGRDGDEDEAEKEEEDESKDRTIGAKTHRRGDQTVEDNDDDDDDDDEEEEEEPAFETMTPQKTIAVLQRPKARAVPILTIYLSRVPIPELKEHFGEQSK